jgi:metallo-beta-lactamase family protein
MADFLANQKNTLKKLFLVHGEIERQESFKTLLSSKGFKKIEIPVLEQAYDIV